MMKNNKILGVCIWVIGLIVVHLIFFAISGTYTATIWITYGFTILAFLTQIILWLCIWCTKVKGSEQFLYMPTLTISVTYLLLQIMLALVFVLFTPSVKVAIIVNGLLTIIIGIVLVLASVAKNTIQQLDRRQKNHHIEL